MSDRYPVSFSSGHGSSWLRPGKRRGDTQCEGDSVFPPKIGSCQCPSGYCNSVWSHRKSEDDDDDDDYDFLLGQNMLKLVVP